MSDYFLIESKYILWRVCVYLYVQTSNQDLKKNQFQICSISALQIEFGKGEGETSESFASHRWQTVQWN